MATEHFSLNWRKVEPVGALVVHMAVSKKFLPRAVDRNRVRRVIREAARTIDANALLIFVRLTRKPVALFKLPDGACKRLLRAELDAGFAQLARRLGAPVPRELA